MPLTTAVMSSFSLVRFLSRHATTVELGFQFLGAGRNGVNETFVFCDTILQPLHLFRTARSGAGGLGVGKTGSAQCFAGLLICFGGLFASAGGFLSASTGSLFRKH